MTQSLTWPTSGWIGQLRTEYPHHPYFLRGLTKTVTDGAMMEENAYQSRMEHWQPFLP